VDVQMADDLRNGSEIGWFVHTVECLDDGIHDLV